MRNLKSLGTVIIALLAFSALASSASAAEFSASETPAVLHASALSAGQVLTTDSGEVVCSELDIEGTIEESPTSSIRAVPTYGGSSTYGESISLACEIWIHEETLRGYVDFQECEYVINANGTLTVDCPEGNEIRITATAFKIGCYGIESQTVSGLEYANNGSYIDITAAVDGLLYMTSGVCAFGTQGEYDGEARLEAENELGEPVDLNFE